MVSATAPSCRLLGVSCWTLEPHYVLFIRLIHHLIMPLMPLPAAARKFPPSTSCRQMVVIKQLDAYRVIRPPSDNTT